MPSTVPLNVSCVASFDIFISGRVFMQSCFINYHAVPGTVYAGTTMPHAGWPFYSRPANHKTCSIFTSPPASHIGRLHTKVGTIPRYL